MNPKDTALLHLAGLVDPSCENERIFGYAEPYNWNEILGLFRKWYPNRTFREDFPPLGKDISKIVPRARAEELLKRLGRPGFIGLEESVKDDIRGLAEA